MEVSSWADPGVLHAYEWRQKDCITNDDKTYRTLTLVVARFHMVVEWSSPNK